MKLAIDVFCGSGSFGKVARTYGYEVISFDSRRRKGICEPSIKCDFSEVLDTFFQSMNVECAWFGLPCTIWSNASGGHHLDMDFNPKTELAKKHLDLLEKVQRTILESNFKYWFIENPRGKLTKYPGFKDFIKKSGAFIYTVTLSSYGFPTTKPTVIISNVPNLIFKELDPFGRSAKNKVPGTFKNMTVDQRQKTPEKLIKSIFNQII